LERWHARKWGLATDLGGVNTQQTLLEAGIWVSMNDEPESGLNLLQKGLQRALVARGAVPVHYQKSALMRRCARVLGKAGLIRPLMRVGSARVIVPVMWASHSTLFSATYFHEVVPFIFDCWPEQFDRWAALLRLHRVKFAYFSARDAAACMAKRVPGLQTCWLPEACDPSRFSAGTPLASRTIHVLEMGRKHGPVHEALRAGLTGWKHLYSEKDSSTPIFETLADLYKGMGDTMVSLCFPKSVTHHANVLERVETMTQRYLETIGSGALAVGVCPGELKELFGFDPVIALSQTDPAGHIRAILADVGAYQEHADRCRVKLGEVGTFEARAQRICETLPGFTA
jgi:hypothetical protein